MLIADGWRRDAARARHDEAAAEARAVDARRLLLHLLPLPLHLQQGARGGGRVRGAAAPPVSALSIKPDDE